jgi:hypothetical protein
LASDQPGAGIQGWPSVSMTRASKKQMSCLAVTGRPARAAPHPPHASDSCRCSRSGRAACASVLPSWPSCPPGLRPLFLRGDRARPANRQAHRGMTGRTLAGRELPAARPPAPCRRWPARSARRSAPPTLTGGSGGTLALTTLGAGADTCICREPSMPTPCGTRTRRSCSRCWTFRTGYGRPAGGTPRNALGHPPTRRSKRLRNSPAGTLHCQRSVRHGPQLAGMPARPRPPVTRQPRRLSSGAASSP